MLNCSLGSRPLLTKITSVTCLEEILITFPLKEKIYNVLSFGEVTEIGLARS